MWPLYTVGLAALRLLPSPQSQGDPSAQKIWDSRADQRIENRVRDDYHLSEEAFANLSLNISQRMIAPNMDYVRGVSVQDRAKSIEAVVIDLLAKEDPSANSLLKERLVAEALYDWTRTHITYNSWLANQRNDRNVRKHYWNAEELFTFNRLTAVCAGISDVVLKMARSLGINAIKVDGFARTDFDSSKLPLDPTKVWHSWVLVRQADGFIFPVDSTIGGVGLERARTLKGVIPRGFTSPSTGLDWLLYLTIYFPSQSGGHPIPSEFALSRMSYSDWLNLDLTGMRQIYSGLTRPIYAASAIESEQPTQHSGRLH